jgi:hypothetical protein
MTDRMTIMAVGSEEEAEGEAASTIMIERKIKTPGMMAQDGLPTKAATGETQALGMIRPLRGRVLLGERMLQ